MSPQNNMSIQVILRVGLAPPPLDRSFLVSAQNFSAGVRGLLSSAEPQAQELSLAVLCGFALECALKAFLAHKGEKRDWLEKKGRHNLAKLWRRAFSKGLHLVTKKPPSWAITLSGNIGVIRYQEVHIQNPLPPQPMGDDTLRVVELVEQELGT
jgi:hypothetical protein